MRFLFISLVFLVSMYQPQAQARERLILTIFPDSDTPNVVIAQTIASKAYRRLEIDIEVIYLPGRRAVNKANNGEVDGLLLHVPNLYLI